MKDFDQLFDAWVDGNITKEEISIFLDELGREHPELVTQLDKLLQDQLYTGIGNEVQAERIFGRIAAAKNKPVAPVRKLVRFRLKWAAAAVLLLITGIAFWYINSSKPQTETPLVVMNNDSVSMPGGDKAVLVLSNGDKIYLDSSADGKLAEQQGASIFKSDDGRIAYQSHEQQGRITEKIEYNTLSVPRGGQFRLSLPDGTNVWLNASSTIRYPTRFNGDERKVSITGEAYFEVAKMTGRNGKKNMPFKVQVDGLTGKEKGMEITVLGTHFNVNAYADEPLAKATLLEGSIKLKKGTDQYLMQPGQQAQLDQDGTFRIDTEINAEEVLAWKNGYFIFDHTDLKTVMRQIARWYDVSIEYRGNTPDFKFGGDIPRKAKLEEVLKILKVSKLQFLVEGKKIIVIP